MVKGEAVAGRSFQLLSHKECQSYAAAMEISDDNWVEVPTRRGAWSSVEVEVAMEERRVVGYEELPGELEVEGDAEVGWTHRGREIGVYDLSRR